MPVAKRLLNAFTAAEVRDVTGISLPMISYLLREGYLCPHYGSGERGQVRYYSYRDLVIARVVQRLREAGVELRRLKPAIQKLAADEYWSAMVRKRMSSTALQLLVTDGKRVLLKSHDGFLEELNGQRSFAFVVHLGSVQAEVKSRIPRRKRKDFSMENRDLIPER